MAGHSKWATTKHKKAIIDARRGKLFAKLVKGVEVAARLGGGDPAGNPALELAILKAKKSSVPNDNIERAVKRGSGAESGGADYETIMYEAYGSAGVGILIECLTDNRNRSATEVRLAVTRNGGTIADIGSVQRGFTRMGVVTVPKEQGERVITEDEILEAALDAGLEDVSDEGENWEAHCDPNDLDEVRKAIEAAGIEFESAEVGFVATFDTAVDELEVAQRVFRIIDALEDCDDVQNVYSNLDLTPEVVEALQNAEE